MRLIAAALAASLAGCASVHPDNSLGIAQTHNNLNMSLGMNRVSIPSGTLLVGALMDEHPAYCTRQAAFFSAGDNRSVCLYDTKQSGYFDKYYILGTLRGDARLEISVPYTLSTQAQVVQTLVQQAPQAAAERNAHADCVYQAQMAANNRPGLIGGLFAGIGAGNACENYYRNIGVMH
jgi:hypothetical protein